MISVLYKEYCRVKDRILKKYFGYHSVSHNWCVRQWKDYLKTYGMPVVENRFKEVLDGLDDSSAMLAKSYFNRMFVLLPDKYPLRKIAVKRESFLTGEEIAEMDGYRSAGVMEFKIASPEHRGVFEHNMLNDNGMIFFPKRVLDYIRAGDFLDGGAFVGDSAVFFSKYGPRRIYSFEPHPKNLAQLRENIELNGLGGLITPAASGLGEKKDRVELFADGSCATVVAQNTVRSDTVSTIDITTIDDVVAKENLRPSLIKLDIEGNEYEAIIGGMKSIKKFKPAMIISVYHRAKDFLEIKPMLDQQVGGYKFIFKKLDPLRMTSEFVFLAYPVELDN